LYFVFDELMEKKIYREKIIAWNTSEKTD
jgi:hypothetical protein